MADWIGLAESAYRLDGELDDWVGGVRDACGAILDQGLGVAVHTFRTTPTTLRTESIAVHAGPPGFEDIVRAANESASPEGVARFLGWGTSVMTMSEAIFAPLPEERDTFMEASRSTLQDVLGVMVLCGGGRGMSISIPIPETRAATPIERRHLGRIGAHLAAGLRLRASLAADPASLDDDDAEAVLDPTGAVRDAHGQASGEQPRARLRHAVHQLEQARSRSRREDPESLGLWEGLVAGRWSLVDRFDSDGRRFIVAHRNEPRLGDPRGLSTREHQVCEHVGTGRSNKEIAYEFGVTESAVANAAGRAQRKLGLSSRLELASFFAPGGPRARLVSFELGGETFAAAAAEVTDENALLQLPPAEREVTLHLLRGATNAEIGRLRGTSQHTVANQVQSIFERLGVRSRVELAARLGGA